MRTLRPGKIVSQLVALFGAPHKGERLASKKSEAGNVNRHVAASRGARESVKQPAARILKAKFIDLVRSQRPLVLAGDTPIMIILGRCTRERILSEVLRTLRLHLDSGLITWAETAPERDSVVASEIMVQAQRV